jgi:hypothetical protein
MRSVVLRDRLFFNLVYIVPYLGWKTTVKE